MVLPVAGAASPPSGKRPRDPPTPATQGATAKQRIVVILRREDHWAGIEWSDDGAFCQNNPNNSSCGLECIG